MITVCSTGRPERPAQSVDALLAQLEQAREEIRQLKQAVASHAVVDQAIGVLMVLGRVPPGEGFAVLRDVSQHTNTKLVTVAEQILEHAQGGVLPDGFLLELEAALRRRASGAGSLG